MTPPERDRLADELVLALPALRENATHLAADGRAQASAAQREAIKRVARVLDALRPPDDTQPHDVGEFRR